MEQSPENVPAKNIVDLPINLSIKMDQDSPSPSGEDNNNNNNNSDNDTDTNLCQVCQHSVSKNCWKKSFVHRWLHAEKTKLYHCQYCNEKFDEFPLLQNHERDHYGAALEQLARNQKILDHHHYQPVMEPETENVATFYGGGENCSPWNTCKIQGKRLKSRRFATIMENYHPLLRQRSNPSYDLTIDHNNNSHVSVIKPPPPPYYGTYHEIIQSNNILYPIPFWQ